MVAGYIVSVKWLLGAYSQVGVWCVWGRLRPITHAILGSSQAVPSELDVFWMCCSYFSWFFSKFVDSTSCMLATWAVPTLPSRNVGPLFSDFFWVSPCEPAPQLASSYFLLPSAPQSSSSVQERFRAVRRICLVAVSCETGQSPPLLTYLLYRFIWGLSFFPV